MYSVTLATASYSILFEVPCLYSCAGGEFVCCCEFQKCSAKLFFPRTSNALLNSLSFYLDNIKIRKDYLKNRISYGYDFSLLQGAVLP
jgi:hypothetical protein